MLLRALALLIAVVALSVLATHYFGNDVLVALGLILTQAKLIAKKLALVEVPAILVWLKAQATVFFRIELLKKWITGSLLPLLLGSAALRRIAAFLGRYRMAIRRQYRRLLRWYRKLHPIEKTIAALIILFATLALSVTSLGLWLILFSVKLPLWLAAAAAALGRMLWASIQKMVFRAVAFLQISWAWRFLQRFLPAPVIRWKRRLDYRVARAVIRRRRLTIRQLAERKDSLPFRMGLLVDYLRSTRSGYDKD